MRNRNHRLTIRLGGISLATALSLSACQNLPETGSLLANEPSAQAVPVAKSNQHASLVSPQSPSVKARTADTGLSLRRRRERGGDRILISLPRSFRTQAVNLSHLAFVRIRIEGLGISTPIQSELIDLNSGIPEIDLGNIPQGTHRIVTAQFYNLAGELIPHAVAMGVYSSSDDLDQPIRIRRRYLPLGRVLLKLLDLSAGRVLIKGLDIANLQSQIDTLLYEPDPPPEPVNPLAYDKDPSLIDVDLIVAELLTNQGDAAALSLNASFVNQTASFELPVTGLLPDDSLRVVVDDPTSSEVTMTAGEIAGNGGKITVTGISPGEWPVYVYLESDIHYPASSFEGTTTPPEYTPADTGQPTNEAPLRTQPFSFEVAQTTTAASYALKPAAPSLSSDDGFWTRSGQTLSLSGSQFYPSTASANKIRFSRVGADGDPIIVATSASSGDAEHISFTVPAAAEFTEAGSYTLSVAVGNSDYTELGEVVVNALAVKTSGGAYNVNSSNGQGWDHAMSLQAALAEADPGESIWVAAGSYKPGSLSSDSFILPQNVEILGGFAGSESDSTQRDPETHISLLEGDLLGNDNSTVTASDPNRGENAFYVVTGASGATLDGFTIQGGNADADAPIPGGGGILINNLSMQLSHLIMRANSGVNGGAILHIAGSSQISDVRFDSNATSGSGAGIFNMGYGSPVLERVQFIGNSSGNGAGTYNNSGTITLSEGIFINNTATGPLGGGGMYNAPDSTAIVDKAVFVNNTAPNGGGVYNYTSHPQYRNTVFLNNTGQSLGGGLYNDFGSNPDLINVTFSGNAAPSGSALYNASGSPRLFNVLLWNNVLGNLSLPGSQGNLQAASDPFQNLSEPAGNNGDWFDDDDGMRLKSSAAAIDQGINSFSGLVLPASDARGLNRPQGLAYEPGAYEHPVP